MKAIQGRASRRPGSQAGKDNPTGCRREGVGPAPRRRPVVSILVAFLLSAFALASTAGPSVASTANPGSWLAKLQAKQIKKCELPLRKAKKQVRKARKQVRRAKRTRSSARRNRARAKLKSSRAKLKKARKQSRRCVRRVKARYAGKYSTVPETGEIFSWIRDLTKFGHRRTGTVNAEKAADYLRKRFKAFGIKDTKIQLADSVDWHPDKWSLDVDGEPIDSFPVWHSFTDQDKFGPFSTGPTGLNAELVDVGNGNAADFVGKDMTGKIAVFDLRFNVPRSMFNALAEWQLDDPESPLTAQELSQANPYLTSYWDVIRRVKQAGAAGFIGVLADYFNSNRYIPEYDPTTMPGLWVTRDAGARIRSLITDGGSATGRLRLEGQRLGSPARTVIATLPGRSKETVMIQCNMDAVWAGAVQDGSGSSEVLALAKHFSSLPLKNREKSLMFVLTDSHFSGYQSHQKFVDTYIRNPDRKYNIVANVTVEHIAKVSSVNPDGSLGVDNKAEPRAVFENVSESIKNTIKDAFTRNKLVRSTMIPTDVVFPILEELPTDADFIYQAGVPTVSFISGPMYLYDEADTLDKVYEHDLRPVALAFTDIVDKLMATPGSQIANPK